MLFVSPVRARVFGHERAGVSTSINAILEKVEKNPGINRKQLAEQLAVADAEAAAAERAKMTLANDLHWLIHEGYVIEFNDGTLDLPRAKAPAAAAPEKTAETAESAPALQPAEEVAEIEVVPISSILEDESKAEEPSQPTSENKTAAPEPVSENA
jgi:hypothetical protein